MSTLLALHAHPDDESIFTGGTLARAAAGGSRIVLITATDGSQSDTRAGVAGTGEELADVRRRELLRAARILGVARVEILGYRDSGMMGDEANRDPRSLWQADTRVIAERVAQILSDEAVETMIVHDDHGIYGHPDHIKVHRAGHLAAQLAGTNSVFEVTVNREHRSRFLPIPQGVILGKSDTEITTEVDVTDWLEIKRDAMLAHASQITPDSWHLRLAPDDYRGVYGTEWFIQARPTFFGSIPDDRRDWLWPINNSLGQQVPPQVVELRRPQETKAELDSERRDSRS